jgi:transcriptional regulator with XRE-family HTH domain
MTYQLEDIGNKLKAARTRKGLSQRELAAKTGLLQAQISKIENGASDLRVSSLIALSRALDLELELIPRKALPAVEALVRDVESFADLRGSVKIDVRPAYSLDDDEEGEDE